MVTRLGMPSPLSCLRVRGRLTSKQAHVTLFLCVTDGINRGWWARLRGREHVSRTNLVRMRPPTTLGHAPRARVA